MARHPEVSFWLCPGDLANDAGAYPDPRAPLYWIKGNNENFDFVAAQASHGGTVSNLRYIPNGAADESAGLRLAGLGGTFAPTWYDTAPEALPSKPRDDKRRHFVREEVEACKALKGIDVFLSHEAPRPFLLETRRGSGPARTVDAGKTPINEVLSAMRPRLHLFGHHHQYSVAERQQVTSIGLDLVSESYLVFDGQTLAHNRLKT